MNDSRSFHDDASGHPAPRDEIGGSFVISPPDDDHLPGCGGLDGKTLEAARQALGTPVGRYDDAGRHGGHADRMNEDTRAHRRAAGADTLRDVNGLRAIRDRSPGLAAFSRSRCFQGLLRTWRPRRAVDSAIQFAFFEFPGRRNGARTYTLRGSAVSITVRHRSRDIEIVDEIFVEPLAYAPPSGAAALLGAPRLRVLDLGGNIGLFGAFVLERYDVSRLTSFEPDPINLPVLRQCRDTNPHASWHSVEACAGTRSAQLQFAAGNHADSPVTADPADSTVTVPSIDVFPFTAEADYVKIDIQGSQWDLLADARFSSIPARIIVMQWHAYTSPFADPHESPAAALLRAGFTVEGEDHGYDHGTVWGWRA